MGLSSKLFDHEIRYFSWRAYLMNRARGRRITSPPVFIVGCGHSGTTMLRHVLGLHPNLYAVPYESRMFFHSNFKIGLAQAVWDMTAIALGKGRWLEKTPAHIYRMERILRHYPESKILLLVRDGRNVALSLRKRWGSFERSVQRWVEDNRAGEPWWEHPRVRMLKYEQLVGDYENQMRALLEFIGEPFDPALLDFTKSAHPQEEQGQGPDEEGAQPRELRDRQLEKGLYGNQEKWRSQMTDEEKVLFKQMAGAMLVEYGYAKDNDW